MRAWAAGQAEQLEYGAASTERRGKKPPKKASLFHRAAAGVGLDTLLNGRFSTTSDNGQHRLTIPDTARRVTPAAAGTA